MTGRDAETGTWRRIATSAGLERLSARIAVRLGVGDAVCLWGPLGAGKSTLARGLVRALTSDDEEVPSPTFTLVQTYETARLSLAHFDLYRLKTAEEAFELGLDEALSEGAVMIEWPQRLGCDLPPQRLDVELRFPVESPAGDSTNGREVRLTGRGSWVERARDIGLEQDF